MNDENTILPAQILPRADSAVKMQPEGNTGFRHLAIFVSLNAETKIGMTKKGAIDWLRRAKAAFDATARSGNHQPWVSASAWRDSVRKCDRAIAGLENGSWFREHGWVDPNKPEYMIRSHGGPGQLVSWEVNLVADFFLKVAT